MERIETLLKHDMGSDFDTRKTLNRSGAKVPDNILEQIESGSFTCEMIDELAKKFPIFRYQTQITIHGEFDVTNSRIGGYKNIFQNQNLSLGVKYSAIDTEKINKIREMLDRLRIYGSPETDELLGLNKNYFYFIQNSQHRVFRRSQKITKENADVLRAEYLALTNKIKEVSIYGYVDCYIMPRLYDGHDIILDVHPLAIPSSKVNELVYAMLNINEESYNEKAELLDGIRAKKKEKEDAEKEERNKRIEAKLKRRTEFLEPYKAAGDLTEIGSLSETTMVCKFAVDEGTEPEFTFKEYAFYRIAGKGSFGKFKVQKALSATFDLASLKWEDYKQMKLAEIKIKGWVVPTYNAISKLSDKDKDEVAAIAKSNERILQKEVKDIYIVDYSDKAIAVLGNTKPYKELLGSNGLGGRFNFALTVDNERVAGWIFPKKRLDEVKTKLGI